MQFITRFYSSRNPALVKPQRTEIRGVYRNRHRNAHDYYFPIETKKSGKEQNAGKNIRVRSWKMRDSPTRTLRHYSGISGNFPAAYITTAAGGGGLLNHCLFPLVVLDFLSTSLLSVSSSHPRSSASFFIPSSLPLSISLSLSFRLLLPTTLVKPPHYPTLSHTGY